MHLHKLSVRLSSAALLLLAAAAPVSAADQASSPSNEASVSDVVNQRPAHATKAEPKEPKKICRSLEQTSSRLQTKKVCLTREQWRNAKYN